MEGPDPKTPLDFFVCQTSSIAHSFKGYFSNFPKKFNAYMIVLKIEDFELIKETYFLLLVSAELFKIVV